MAAAASATSQFCGCLATAQRPASSEGAVGPAGPIGAGVSGGRSRTTSQIAAASRTPKPAAPARALRQPAVSTRAASGAWPPIPPSMPSISVRPETWAKRSGGNHAVASLRVATKPKPAPAPIRRRPK